MERILAIVKASTHNEADLERCMDVVNNSLRTFHVRSGTHFSHVYADAVQWRHTLTSHCERKYRL